MSKAVTITIADGVARIRIDDGKVNAMSASLMLEIEAALDEAKAAEAVVVFSGKEGMLSAGFDLKTFKAGPEATRAMLRGGASLIIKLLEFPFPVLGVCTGHAYPMGAFLLLASDVRFAVAGDWRIGMNEVAIALTIPHFALELARHRLTPPGFVRATTAEMFGPEEAKLLGYVDRVIAPDELENAVDMEALRLLALDFPTHAAVKQRIHGATSARIRELIDQEFPAA